jgi:hypothetical protein
MDKSESSDASAGKAPSMKERLLAQRKAEADAAARSAADPKMAAAASRPVAKPAPAPTPAPAARPAPTMSPRARVAAASAAAGAPSAAERMAARRGAPHPHTELSPDVKREVQLLKQRESKTMMYVWIVCGVLFLAAAGFLGNTLMKRHAADVKEQEYQNALDNLLKSVKAKDPLKEADAKQILETCNEPENKALWRQSRIEGEIARAMSLSQRTIDSAADRRDMDERLAALEATAQSADSQAMDTIKSARRTAQDLTDKGSGREDEYKKRVAAAREKVDRAYLQKVLADAKAKGQTREALSAFTLAEIETRNALDNKLSGTKDAEVKKWYQDLYKTLLNDSDAVAVAVFNPAVVDGEPWKDALLAESDWLHSPELTGFQLKDGQLHVVGPKAGGGRLGSMSVADRAQLKDFVMTIEFTPIKGNFDIYFRVYNRMDSSDYTSVNTVGKDPQFKTGQSYTMEVRMIGSTMSIKVPNTDIEPFETQVGPTKQRFGSIGFKIYEETEFKITAFKYKELRSNKRQ